MQESDVAQEIVGDNWVDLPGILTDYSEATDLPMPQVPTRSPLVVHNEAESHPPVQNETPTHTPVTSGSAIPEFKADNIRATLKMHRRPRKTLKYSSASVVCFRQKRIDAKGKKYRVGLAKSRKVVSRVSGISKIRASISTKLESFTPPITLSLKDSKKDCDYHALDIVMAPGIEKQAEFFIHVKKGQCKTPHKLTVEYFRHLEDDKPFCTAEIDHLTVAGHNYESRRNSELEMIDERLEYNRVKGTFEVVCD